MFTYFYLEKRSILIKLNFKIGIKGQTNNGRKLEKN